MKGGSMKYLLTFILVMAMAVPVMAFQLDLVPYVQGTVWSDSDTRPNFNFGAKFEAKNLCSYSWCKYVELYAGYDIGRFTAENAEATACTNPLGCTSNPDGSIPSMTKVYYDPHWDQTFFMGIQSRIDMMKVLSVFGVK
jgi:hypothetical protein